MRHRARLITGYFISLYPRMAEDLGSVQRIVGNRTPRAVIMRLVGGRGKVSHWTIPPEQQLMRNTAIGRGQMKFAQLNDLPTRVLLRDVDGRCRLQHVRGGLCYHGTRAGSSVRTKLGRISATERNALN
eukprot:22583-Pyramimonas_sp.AAC.1